MKILLVEPTGDPLSSLITVREEHLEKIRATCPGAEIVVVPNERGEIEKHLNCDILVHSIPVAEHVFAVMLMFARDLGTFLRN